ncbi:AraC family transcriptional regulator [Synergistaceae bacterium OttesenSCG-928-I11]|nr:AraC family transcriptional regulator [Synergistaceae bacterium OttesenSCG-928-I11]
MGSISRTYWRTDQARDLDFLTASYNRGEAECHFHHGFTISAVESGSLPMLFRDFRAILHPGELLFMGPDVPHSFDGGHQVDGCSYRTLTHPGGRNYRELEEMLKCRRNSICIIRDEALWRDFLRGVKGVEEGESRNVDEVDELSRNLFSDASRHEIWKFDVRIPQVRAAKRYIDANYRKSPDIDEIATASGLSPRHFTRLFKSEVGMTAHRYLNQLKVNAARKMLAAGVPMLWLTYELGFTDQSHFSKTFSKLTGVSPLRYASGTVSKEQAAV